MLHYMMLHILNVAGRARAHGRLADPGAPPLDDARPVGCGALLLILPLIIIIIIIIICSSSSSN